MFAVFMDGTCQSVGLELTSALGRRVEGTARRRRHHDGEIRVRAAGEQWPLEQNMSDRRDQNQALSPRAHPTNAHGLVDQPVGPSYFTTTVPAWACPLTPDTWTVYSYVPGLSNVTRPSLPM